MIHCANCGVVPVPRADLPVELPDDVDFDRPGNPLDRHPTWRDVACPHCGGPAKRETDTMDTFVDSSWYFARFTAPHADDADRRAPRSTPGCRSTSISAASSTRSCISSIRASSSRAMRKTGHVGLDEPFDGHVHAGHGRARDLPRRGGRVADARRGAHRGRRRVAPRLLARHRRAGRDRRRSKRCRSRSATPSTRPTSSRATAPTRRAGSCCPTRRPSAT